MNRTNIRQRRNVGNGQLDLDIAPTRAMNVIRDIREALNLSPAELAQYLGSSLVSVVRWERGDTSPNAKITERLKELHTSVLSGEVVDINRGVKSHVFASRGARRTDGLALAADVQSVSFSPSPKKPIATRLQRHGLWGQSKTLLASVLADNSTGARTISTTADGGVSAGKNTYTYDAHTYHTKVPPQGIVEVIKRYLPDGGVVLDPFSGSGMTGVAALTLGYDVVLNELSPAASFISHCFTQKFDPVKFSAAAAAVCDRLRDLRRDLYSTNCRACGQETEVLYTVWSYRVRCTSCSEKFTLWDHCRQYGRTVKEHKILKEFACPKCAVIIKKSRLPREEAVPVLLGYKCCSKYQVEHPLTASDLDRIERYEKHPVLADGFVPTMNLPDGVNLGQPKRHGLTSVDRFYTGRNLSAMSHLWRVIHELEDDEQSAFLAFVFTSLYQRVTKLSEFRFWGGSGNTANFNVPYIQNEANVFVTFERKARTIQDHLGTTAQMYKGRAIVHTGSATDLSFLPDESVDMVFTDPPFGANINYSEMNILWESWLGVYTDPTKEAIVNKVQGKDVARYGELMTDSLRECHRVLRPGHWMIVVFMNSSEDVWASVRSAIADAGFALERVDIFDKQHGTFKQFVSDNAAGCDLMLHCRKPIGEDDGLRRRRISRVGETTIEATIKTFLGGRNEPVPRVPYLHVRRQEEIDYRMLYSEFLSRQLVGRGVLVDFPTFRSAATSILEK